ncbi:Solute carrier family 2, facilitated glucose transporter member 3 [Varanus komodoensis]|nr:Solute carrier family 2, facilitated glucose transporter member 3 [Varanus komodoensis]
MQTLRAKQFWRLHHLDIFAPVSVSPRFHPYFYSSDRPVTLLQCEEFLFTVHFVKMLINSPYTILKPNSFKRKNDFWKNLVFVVHGCLNQFCEPWKAVLCILPIDLFISANMFALGWFPLMHSHPNPSCTRGAWVTSRQPRLPLRQTFAQVKSARLILYLHECKFHSVSGRQPSQVCSSKHGTPPLCVQNEVKYNWEKNLALWCRKGQIYCQLGCALHRAGAARPCVRRRTAGAETRHPPGHQFRVNHPGASVKVPFCARRSQAAAFGGEGTPFQPLGCVSACCFASQPGQVTPSKCHYCELEC